jgi:hypothetical protein
MKSAAQCMFQQLKVFKRGKYVASHDFLGKENSWKPGAEEREVTFKTLDLLYFSP